MTELRRDAPVERGAGYTVILKRPDPHEPEPFPEGTRYIIVPGDNRGLAETIGFAVVFVLSGLLFAFTTPAIGLMLFLFFTTLAVILVAASFFKVGVIPILIDMRAPPEESGFWNEEFENGKVLVFASSEDKKSLRPVWELMQERSTYFDVIGRRLVPRPGSKFTLPAAFSPGSRRPYSVKSRSLSLLTKVELSSAAGLAVSSPLLRSIVSPVSVTGCCEVFSTTKSTVRKAPCRRLGGNVNERSTDLWEASVTVHARWPALTVRSVTTAFRTICCCGGAGRASLVRV